MSENKFETVSVLMDDETTEQQHLNSVVDDAEMSDTWSRYHLIRDTLKEESSSAVSIDLSASIAQAIEQEPTVLAPQPKSNVVTKFKAKVVQFAKPVGQMAIAASAAGLMIIGVQNNVAENELEAPAQVIQTTPFAGVADPVSYNFSNTNQKSQKQAYIEQQRRFNALLADHKQQIKLSSVTRQEDTEQEDTGEK